MKYRQADRFKKCFAGLPKDIQEKAREAFQKFKENPKHPSLRTHKMKGHKDIWEGHVDLQYCFTFHYEIDPNDGETWCVFRVIGLHDIYKNP